jgi:transposase-like protein
MPNTVGQESNASSENKVSWLPRKVRPIGWAAGKVKFRLRPKKSFSPEFKDEAVKMVVETSRPIASVAKELGISGGTLGSWVRADRREHAREEAPLALEGAPLTLEEPPVTIKERARLNELERESGELKMELEFLKSRSGPARPGLAARRPRDERPH